MTRADDTAIHTPPHQSYAPCRASLVQLQALVQHAAAAHAWLQLCLSRSSYSSSSAPHAPRLHTTSWPAHVVPASNGGAPATASSFCSTQAAALTRRKMIRTTPMQPPWGACWTVFGETSVFAPAATACVRRALTALHRLHLRRRRRRLHPQCTCRAMRNTMIVCMWHR